MSRKLEKLTREIMEESSLDESEARLAAGIELGLSTGDVVPLTAAEEASLNKEFPGLEEDRKAWRERQAAKAAAA